MWRLRKATLTFILYELSSFVPLMVKTTMLSILNTVRTIFMRIYSSEEEVKAMYRV